MAHAVDNLVIQIWIPPTISIDTPATTIPVPAPSAALESCNANYDRLLHSTKALAAIAIILFILSLTLSCLLWRKNRLARKELTPAEKRTEGPDSPPEKPERLRPFSANEKVIVLPSSLQSSHSSLSKPPLEPGDVAQETRALSRTAYATSVHDLSEDEDPPPPCVQPRASVIPQDRHSQSQAQSIAAISIDDFDGGKDDDFHPGVRALLEEGRLTKEALRNLKPMAPRAGTVIPGYNHHLDEARPREMDEYLLNYRILFIIDDSRSMVRRWDETRDALSQIAKYALTYHSDAVDIRFFNSPHRDSGVQGVNEVMGTFQSVTLSRGTPTGRALKEVFDEQLDRLDNAQMMETYSSERPLDIIVLTDGVPNSDSPPAPVIKEAANRLKATGHHQNWISVQFVQIGNDRMAAPTLLSLVDCANNNHMVDTIAYSFYKDEGGGKLTADVLERIILGGLHPNLRAYYNQFRRKMKEKTSQVIF